MKDSILILSGGVDSTTLLYDYQERIALAVTFAGAGHASAKSAASEEYFSKIFSFLEPYVD